jgi:LmbE family N-acetylglucosaminyl deacetylase
MRYLPFPLVVVAAFLLAPAAWVQEGAPLKATPAKKLTILAVGAHMDDAEIGMGGILISAVKAGHRVVVVVTVSDYTTWALTIGREEQCKKDQLDLAKRFGYEKRFLDYPYHQFPADNEAKKKLAAIYVELLPDITFVHNWDDRWPDHANSGRAAHDAVLFAHGYTDRKKVRRCPQVFAFCATPAQTIHFEPDRFVDVTPVMSRYMELLAGTDACLTGRPAEEQYIEEVRNLRTGESLRMSGHGRLRYLQCASWAAQNGGGRQRYCIGLKTLWGPRDEKALW